MPALRAGLALIAVVLSACSPSKREAAVLSSPSPSADPGRPLPDPWPEIVARVNGQPITLAQLLPAARRELSVFPKPDREEQLPAAMRGALDKYVTRELLLQEAMRRGITADARAVERAYDRMHEGHAQEPEWTAFLAAQGLDPRTLRAELRVQHTVAALLADEVARFPIAAAEARAAYDANPSAFGTLPDGKPPGFEAVRAQLELRLRQSRRQQIQGALQARLRRDARIAIFL